MVRIFIIGFSLLWSLLVVAPVRASQEIEDLVRGHLLRHYNSDEIRIEGLRYPDISIKEVSDIEIEEGLQGITLILFKLRDGRTIKTTAKVSPLSRVLVAKDSLEKGRLLKEDNLEFCFVEKGSIPHGAFRDKGELIGLVLTRAIAKGTVITHQMVTDHSAEVTNEVSHDRSSNSLSSWPPKDQVIKKGSRVMIVVETRSFRISMPGELLRSTRPGEHAKAINLQTKKTVSGILLDKDTLFVEF